jgi:DNA-binding response OmpR family regulator
MTDQQLAAPTHVVVVDDRVDRRRVLSATLRSGARADVEISEVDVAAVAMAVVRGRHVDAVLVEISLPGAIGLIRSIRGFAAEMVILVCSFAADPVTRGHALDAGATAYLTKPFGARELQRAITGDLGGDPSGSG